ncbi:MAG: DUF3871 family protein [Rikenellaceae bacterium]
MNTTELFYNEQTDSFVEQQQESNNSPFILGNTQEIGLQQLQDDYLIPVFSRDNTETISHSEFINTIMDAAQTYFQGEQFLTPQVRVSHEMKLRTRTGYGKLVENLTDDDSNSYFQRMMFMIEIPSITHNVNGCNLNLQIVGVRSYSETNLLGNSSQKQSFQLGIGFLNRVCCNMNLSTNGVNSSIKVTNTADLYIYSIELFSQYHSKLHIDQMRRLNDTIIDVKTFAQFLGKCRLYAALPQRVKTELNLPDMILNEAQINNCVKDYYRSDNFGGGEDGSISAWQMLNLLTNYKSNYIDTTIDRSVNAFDVVSGVARAIQGIDDTYSWFIE